MKKLHLFALALLAAPSAAQTITVDTSADDVDIDWTSATLADLPGPDGKVSLSEALIASNHTPGHQTIAFNIPQSDWTYQWLHPGKAVLSSGIGYFWVATDPVTIDGTTQTAFTGDTNPAGHEVVLYGANLTLSADGCLLKGLDSSLVTLAGASGCQVLGNTGVMQLSVFEGSGNLIQDNSAGTIKLDRTNQNVVVGNTAQRVRVLGWASNGQPAVGNQIGGPTPQERNFLTGYGTVNGEGLPSGSTLQLVDTTGTRVINNRIGTTPDGSAQGSLVSTMGVEVGGQTHDLELRDNQISGIRAPGQGPHYGGTIWGWGIFIAGEGHDVRILGNAIGLDAAGAPTLGAVWGISVGDAVTHPSGITGLVIGGIGPGEANQIAGHRLNGITIGRTAPPVAIRGNSIHDNDWLGIDLIPTVGSYGADANDPLDADTGGNGLQNHPLLVQASLEGPELHVVGELRTAPGAYLVDVYASSVCDDYAGAGEGEVYLGGFAVSTDSAGIAPIDERLSTLVPQGWVVSATATSQAGETSEFGPCVTVSDPTAGVGFCFGDGGGAPCPCANPGSTGYGCAHSASSTGALLLALGSSSVQADDLVLRVVQSVPGAPGLFFQGTNQLAGGLGVPFGDGLRCAGGTARRLQIRAAGADGSTETTVSLVAAGSPQPGQQLAYQWWYRDPSGSPCGSAFNLSSGVQVTWQP